MAPPEPASAVSVTKAISTPGKKPSSKSYKESVTLVVGTSKEHYTLHKDLLCFYSDFFRAAFNGSFKEAVERKIELPDTETGVFEAFQVWIYTQSFPKNEISTAAAYPEWPVLVRLWVFGDKYQTPLLQNDSMDAMLEKVVKDGTNPLFSIKFVYENTTPNSHLRKAIADMMAYKGKMYSEHTKETCLSGPECWTVQACLDTMAAMDRGWDNKNARSCLPTKEKCHYHVHAEGEHC